MNLLRNKRFNSVALGHLYVDTLNGLRSVVFAYISGILGLSNSVLGIISTVYIIVSNLIQPIFGYLADKIGPKSMVAGGVIWMASFFTLSAMTQGFTSIILLIVASIGSGVFHPAGTNQATIEGKKFLSGRETTALSFFVLFGGTGGFIGPILSGSLLNKWGLNGLIGLGIIGIPIGFYAMHCLPSKNDYLKDQNKEEKPIRISYNKKLLTGILVVVAFIAAFQAWINNTLLTFLPKYMSDFGADATEYGLFVSIYAICATIGNLIGGNIADSIGKHRVVMASMILSIMPLSYIVLNGYSNWFYLIIPLAGFFVGAGYSSIVVIAQRVIPTGPALATGIILSFIFTSGALGTMASGYIADIFGYSTMFLICVILALFAGILTLLLNNKKEVVY